MLLFVIRLEKNYQVKDLESEDVAVEMIACPVNPSDINTIQGKLTFCSLYLISFDDACFFSGVYPIKPALPAVGGGEGVGVVRETGESVTTVKSGDWVIPAGPALGIVILAAHSYNGQPI